MEISGACSIAKSCLNFCDLGVKQTKVLKGDEVRYVGGIRLYLTLEFV